ncbi:MAG: substrate-binding domain-containing protein [Bacteroidia bacterium]|nr:substrate-binding domain-containing protein [Bacteroidia bacterium]
MRCWNDSFLSAKLLTGCILVISFFLSCNNPFLPTAPKYKIGFSQCTGGDNWRKAMLQEMQRELAFHPEITFEMLDAEGNSSKQAEQIQQLVDSKVDILIVSPNEAEPITPVVEKAFSKGIPVITIDRRITSSRYNAYIGADNYEIGKTAGSYVADLLNGKGKILEIWGLPGSSPAVDRHNGFQDALRTFPEIEIVASVNGDWEKEIAEKALPEVLVRYPEIDIIFGHNDIMVLGAYGVCKKMGREDNIRFIGVDGLAGPGGGIEMVNEGILDATFLYSTGGEDAIRVAINILENQPYQKENILVTTAIDPSNVRIMKQQTDKILSQQKDIQRQKEMIGQQLEIYKNQRTILYVMGFSLIFVLVLGGLALYSMREKQAANRVLADKNQEIILQRNQIMEMAEKARNATEEKFRFFTNISHEFRTPLTLILGPVEELLETDYSKENIKHQLGLIRRNSIRLLYLVEQLMDFRKIENGKMRVQATENDLSRFIKDIYQAFEFPAQKRVIDFRLVGAEKPMIVWFDKNMLDKVLFNLLSNAFKFTNDHGFIYIRIQENRPHNQVLISVEDNGRGMAPEQVSRVFERFYQGESYSTSGTGLGLSLSRELIHLHKGSIGVESEDLKGTRFFIFLPLGNSHFGKEEIGQKDNNYVTMEYTGQYIENEKLAYLTEENKPEKETSVLIIEDNLELMGFLNQALARDYHILEATDGRKGLEVARESIPDLIICDVMLPEINGLRVVSYLKSDLYTSHIPIVLLTAQDTEKQSVVGLEIGADSYIIKPFNLNFLKATLKSLLKNREILRERFISEISMDIPVSTENRLDKKFISQFVAAVENNLSNPELNVQDICEQIGMSRIQVYRKVKALMGYSVGDYIKHARLKKAEFLLTENVLSISEIAYQVGFNSPAYFSTAFKSAYNLSPTEFKLQKNTTTD